MAPLPFPISLSAGSLAHLGPEHICHGKRKAAGARPWIVAAGSSLYAVARDSELSSPFSLMALVAFQLLWSPFEECVCVCV